MKSESETASASSESRTLASSESRTIASSESRTIASSESRTSTFLAALAAFSIDDTATAHYSFSRRLAHEHRWSHGFAERAIVEYKRFLALTSLAGHLVCPSEQVDQVWHLHLTYTRSYWERLCPQVLGRPLHHTPTAGGPAEHDKHVAMYERTLASYRRLFGEAPPADLWPPSSQRFGKDVHAARVSTADNLILSKATLFHSAILSAAILAAALASWLTA